MNIYMCLLCAFQMGLSENIFGLEFFWLTQNGVFLQVSHLHNNSNSCITVECISLFVIIQSKRYTSTINPYTYIYLSINQICYENKKKRQSVQQSIVFNTLKVHKFTNQFLKKQCIFHIMVQSVWRQRDREEILSDNLSSSIVIDLLRWQLATEVV